MLNRVLILEDDVDILENLSTFLSCEGFEVLQTSHLSEFKTLTQKTEFALAIVDLGLPDGSGLEAVSFLRDNTKVGIIVLTAQDGFSEKMKGYEAGADYYFTKPTSPPELLAAAKSILSRLHQDTTSTEIDETTWLLLSNNWVLRSPEGIDIPLTNKEMQFLSEIANSPDNNSSKDTLLKLLGYEAKGLHGQKAMDVMITRLRKKIKEITGETAPIKTIHQVGMKFTNAIKLV